MQFIFRDFNVDNVDRYALILLSGSFQVHKVLMLMVELNVAPKMTSQYFIIQIGENEIRNIETRKYVISYCCHNNVIYISPV